MKYLLLAIIAGCAYTTMEAESDSKRLTQPLVVTSGVVTVHALFTSDVAHYCPPGSLACASLIGHDCYLYTETPTWGNTSLLRNLGHEVMHCFGATHE